MNSAAVDLPNEPYWRITPTESPDYKDWLEKSDQIYAILVQAYLDFYRNNEERYYYFYKKFQQHLYENPERQYLIKTIADEIAMQPITLSLSLSDIKKIPEGMLNIENIIKSGHGTLEISDNPETGLPNIRFIHESQLKKPLD